jgi:probable F420-dependent oxidoreductase
VCCQTTAEVGIVAKRFRFGAVVGLPSAGARQWRDQARRVADLGYSTLLMPDGMQLLSPFPTLAVAAEATNLRVGTFVLASPMRPARLAAWESHSMTALTGGRFEMGIGTGRPEVREWVEAMGLPFGSPSQRLQQVTDTIDALRALDGEVHTPVMMAAAGPKALAVAAARADIVTLAVATLAPREQFAAMADRVRELAGERADQVELSMNIFVVGDRVAPWVERFIGADAETLIAHDSLTMLRGTAEDMAAELVRRREQTGVSYITVNSAAMEDFAPVISLLDGH